MNSALEADYTTIRRILMGAMTIWYIVGLMSVFVAEQEKGVPVLEVRLRTNVTSIAQVFFDDGLGIRPEDSSVATVYAGPVSRTYQLPLAAARINALRFDPLICAGEMVIESARVKDTTGHTLCLLNPSDFTAANQIESWQKQSNGSLRIVAAESPEPDSELTIHLSGPLDLSASDHLSAARSAELIGFHTLLLGGLAWATSSAWKLIGKERWGRWTELLPGGEEVYRLELLLYLTSVFWVIVMSASSLEQVLLKHFF